MNIFNKKKKRLNEHLCVQDVSKHFSHELCESTSQPRIRGKFSFDYQNSCKTILFNALFLIGESRTILFVGIGITIALSKGELRWNFSSLIRKRLEVTTVTVNVKTVGSVSQFVLLPYYFVDKTCPILYTSRLTNLLSFRN